MRGCIEINLGALRHNWSELSKLTPGECGAVVKANAYGLGVNRIAPALYDEGCRSFFVANCEEGLELRAVLKDRFDARIIVFAGAESGELALCDEHKLTPVVIRVDMLDSVLSYRKQNTFAFPDLFLHVDTGMSRYGLSLDELDNIIRHRKEDLLTLKPKYFMSHYSTADEPTRAHTSMQTRVMHETLTKLREFGLKDLRSSFANSQALVSLAEYSGDLVRPGIGLYGGLVKGFSNEAQRNVIRATAPVRQIRTLQRGEAVGYGAEFVASSDMTVAIVAMGYADGLPRSGSREKGGFNFHFNNYKLPIIGRVSMDACAVRLPSELADSALGESVVCFETINQLNEMASTFDTIDYEILTRLSTRFSRRYTL